MHILSKRSVAAIVAGTALISSVSAAPAALAAGPGMMNGSWSGRHATSTARMHGRTNAWLGGNASTTPAFRGNGMPIVGGTVTAVNGSSIAITNASNAAYTIDAANANIVKAGVANATAANIAVGDELLVQGSVNGSSVTAASIIDQAVRAASSTPSASAARGMMGAIRGFFSRMFGFF